MKPLQKIKQMLIWLYMCEPEKTASKWTKIKYFLVGLVILVLNLTALTAHFTYCYVNLSNDLKNSMFACFGIFGFFGVSYIMITALFLQEEIMNIFERLTEIYGMCKLFMCINYSTTWAIVWLIRLFSGKNTEMSRFLIGANQTSEWVWRIIWKFMLAYCCNISMLTFASGFYYWLLNKNLVVHELYHPLNMMWDQLLPNAWKVYWFIKELWMYWFSDCHGIKVHLLDTLRKLHSTLWLAEHTCLWMVLS